MTKVLSKLLLEAQPPSTPQALIPMLPQQAMGDHSEQARDQRTGQRLAHSRAKKGSVVVSDDDKLHHDFYFETINQHRRESALAKYKNALAGHIRWARTPAPKAAVQKLSQYKLPLHVSSLKDLTSPMDMDPSELPATTDDCSPDLEPTTHKHDRTPDTPTRSHPPQPIAPGHTRVCDEGPGGDENHHLDHLGKHGNMFWPEQNTPCRPQMSLSGNNDSTVSIPDTEPPGDVSQEGSLHSQLSPHNGTASMPPAGGSAIQCSEKNRARNPRINTPRKRSLSFGLVHDSVDPSAKKRCIASPSDDELPTRQTVPLSNSIRCTLFTADST